MSLFSARTLSAKSPAIPVLMGQPALVPVKLTGREGLNGLFEYKATFKTPVALEHLLAQAANFKLSDFIGQEMTLCVELVGNAGFGDGGREISGLITDARFVREGGRHVLYELTLKPWLHLATLTSDCKVFQDMTVVDVFDALFADYPFPVDKRLVESYPKRDYQTQLNETDHHFFSRLCEEWGINYFFEHREGKHRLVLIDAMAAHQKFPHPFYQTLDFYTPSTKIDQEFVDTLMPVERIVTGRYATNEYDYTRPKADLNAINGDPRPTAHNEQEIYHWHADSHYSQPKAGADKASNDPAAEGGMLARLRMQSLRSPGQRAHGGGNLRAVVPGCTFTLKRHPQDAANIDYLVLWAELLIEEVSQESESGEASGDSYRVHTRFEVHAASQPFRPERTTPKPFTHGPQVAIVVGPDNENIWTDEYGRIKVQFPWDRYGKLNQHSSCWVRVSAPWAGNQLGAMHLPRIGQEVIIDHIGGDPDLPICTGRVYNQMNLPPWKLPDQQALSGLRSRELTQGNGNAASGRSNHLVLDDTAGKIQAQIKSDHLHSAVALGHIGRIEDNAGRKDGRGQGFELRTDGHGVVRAQAGMLITTEGRIGAQGAMKDMAETVQRLTQARSQHESLAEIAQTYEAQEAGADQEAVAKALKEHNDAIKGSGAPDPESGNFPELEKPHLVLASPAGIHTTTEGTTHVASGQHIALTSGESLSLSVGKRWLASVSDGIRLFVNRAGMKLIAANNDIDVKALKNCINLFAKLDITQTANRIILTAKEEVVINGGGSYIKLKSGSIEQGTSGTWVAHAASHSFTGPKSLSASLPEPAKLGKGQMELFNKYANLKGLKGSETKVIDNEGSAKKAVLDEQGFSTVGGLAGGPADVSFGKDPREPFDDGSFMGKRAWPEREGLMSEGNGDSFSMGSALGLVGQALAGVGGKGAGIGKGITALRGATENGVKGLLSQAVPSVPTSVTQGLSNIAAQATNAAVTNTLSKALPGATAGVASNAVTKTLAGMLPAGLPTAAMPAMPGVLPNGLPNALQAPMPHVFQAAGMTPPTLPPMPSVPSLPAEVPTLV